MFYGKPTLRPQSEQLSLHRTFDEWLTDILIYDLGRLATRMEKMLDFPATFRHDA